MSAGPVCLLLAALAQEPIALVAGAAHAGELAVDEPGHVDFRLALPADVIAVDLELDCPAADLDLAATPAGAGHSLEAPDWVAHGEEGQERLHLRRVLVQELGGESLDVRVLYAYEEAPIFDGRPLSRAAFRLTARVFASRVDAPLVPLQPQRATLESASGGFRVFSVEVPERATCLRIDLFDVDGDLDLFASHRVRVVSSGPRTASAMNPWGTEHLRIEPDGTPGLRAGTWFVHVENLVDPLERASFGIVASFEREAPACVRGLPEFPPPRAVERPADAVPAVFELFSAGFGGSGTCLSRDGWILTNAHVVAGGPHSEVIVCVPLERGRAARESFVGRVVEFDAARDLALVKVERGFHGEEIPADYAFPWVPLREGGWPELGEELWLVGYPGGGGQRTRVTVSVSRGIVSGYESGDFGLVLKTDAELQVGSSGGAALDARGRLLGVPSTLVEVGAGQFGYVHPLQWLPPQWRARFAAGAAK